MTLDLPNLDDRTFDDLLQELLERIPTYTPEWTDFNDSDPGITLLQLWTHLVEVMLNRLNLLPERAHLSFLNLVGVTRRPGLPARAHVTFETIPTAGQASILERTPIQSDPGDGGPPLVFETVRGLDPVMQPLSVLQFVPLVGRPQSLTDGNVPGGPELTPLGTSPEVDDSIYFGFGEPRPGVPFSFPPKLVFRFFETETRLSDEPSDDRRRNGPSSVQFAWEYREGPDTEDWHRLETLSDETGSLQRPGYVEIEGPRDVRPVGTVGVETEPRYWIRCRFADGEFPDRKYPRFGFVRVNTVEVEQLETIEGQVVAVSDGRPGFSAEIADAPVDPDTLILDVEAVGGVPERWGRTENLFAAGRDEKKFVLDSVSGRVSFGDGPHGGYPVAGAAIIARRYRWGGGRRGNVSAGAIADIPAQVAGVASVTNERRATGGSDPESVDDLKIRAAHEIRSGGSLVTAADFESFVQGIGGVARAAALPNTRPGRPRFDAPGSVTIVVVPEPGGDRPQPSDQLLRFVSQEIEPRRLITTDVYVVGPTYRTLSVTARVHAQANTSFTGITNRVKQALRDYIAPVRIVDHTVPTFSGWPFGRDLIPTSMFGVIEDAEGVAAVPMLELRVDGQVHHDLREPIILNRTELFSVGELGITVVTASDLDVRDSLS